MANSDSAAEARAGGLPEAVTGWLETALAGRIVRTERSVSRREGWLVDLECGDGRRLEGFLRLERWKDGELRQPSCQVRMETTVIAALHARGVPVPAVVAHDEALQATLFERAPGRDDVHEIEDALQQGEVARDFMRQLARVHALPIEDMDLPGVARPRTADEYALAGIPEIEGFVAATSPTPDPLARLTFAWLRRNVPPPPSRPALVQGDTGPGNFVYVDDRVSAILDWECAHVGDPMEDLGHLYSRAFFHPWGDMSPLLDVYAQNAKDPLDESKLHFYRVASFAKAALGSTAAVNLFQVEGPLPMMIFFSAAGERGLAQSLADALGVEVEAASLPDPDPGRPRSLSLPIERASDHIAGQELARQLANPYLQERAMQLGRLAQYQAKRERHLSALIAQELEELRPLVGRDVTSVDEGLARLDALIGAWDDARIADIARYLTRRAQRAEALALPLAGRYVDRKLSPIHVRN